MAVKGYSRLLSFDTDGKLLVGRMSEFTITEQVQTKEVDGWPYENPDGILQTVDAWLAQQKFDIKVGTGSFDKLTISQAFDQKLKTEASVLLPHNELLTVGAGGTIAIAGLIANQSVGIFLQSDTDPVQYEQITSGTPTDKQFTVTAGNITMAASQVGKQVIVNYFKTYSAIESLGVSNNPIGYLGMIGRMILTRTKVGPLVYIPKMTKFSGVTFGGEKSEVTYRALLKPPFAKPVVFCFDVPEVAV
jgi:hypothetical protein